MAVARRTWHASSGWDGRTYLQSWSATCCACIERVSQIIEAKMSSLPIISSSRESEEEDYILGSVCGLLTAWVLKQWCMSPPGCQPSICGDCTRP